MADADRIQSWLSDHRAEVVARLAAWVRVPSVAGIDDSADGVRRSAQWLAAEFTDLGMPAVEVWADAGPPAVWGSWPAQHDAPTVLVYSHHDVRTTEGQRWTVGPPFQPTERDGRLYGRGSSDAKGQVLAHLWALRALLAAGADAPPVNLKFIVEGEEELGSPHLADMLAAHAEAVDADLVVVSDTMTWSAQQPAVCIGNRGLIKGEVCIEGSEHELHSGAVSGVAPNPVNELLRVLGGLHDAEGRVAIPRFYDDVREVSDDERAELQRLGGDDRQWLARTGMRSLVGERGRSLAERLYVRPAADVLAIAGGDAEPPTRGAIATSASAQVQLSLVPDQRPDVITQLLRDWVAAQVSPAYTQHVDVPEDINQPPYETPADHPGLAVLRQAMADAWECPVPRMRNAGGGPGALLSKAVGAPVLYFGTGLPEDNWHSADESVDVDVLLRGSAALALFWDRLAPALNPHR